MSNRAIDISQIKQTKEVQLCSLSSKKPFEKVLSDFEKQLGRFDQAKILSAKNPRDTIKTMEGESGLMIIHSLDMGALLPALSSSSIKAKQYLIGNPLIASSMAHHNALAALYAPPRVLIYTTDNKTWISYDLPSTSFGNLGSSDIDQIAKNLDEKFESLIRVALS